MVICTGFYLGNDNNNSFGNAVEYNHDWFGYFCLCSSNYRSIGYDDYWGYPEIK